MVLEEGHLNEWALKEAKGSRPSQHIGSVTGSFSFILFPSYFLLLCMPGNFYLDARHCKFCLLGAGYLCLPINTHVIEFCSGMHISYLQVVYGNPFRSCL